MSKKRPINLNEDEIHLIVTTLRLAGARPKKEQTKRGRKVRPTHRKNMDKLLDKMLKHDAASRES